MCEKWIESECIPWKWHKKWNYASLISVVIRFISNINRQSYSFVVLCLLSYLLYNLINWMNMEIIYLFLLKQKATHASVAMLFINKKWISQSHSPFHQPIYLIEFRLLLITLVKTLIKLPVNVLIISISVLIM